jgi:cytochrome c oxidase subunit IV
MAAAGAGREATRAAVAPTRTYVGAWAGLLVLLALTIAVARLHIPSFGVALNLIIATAKAGLVLVFFMHLRSEGRFLKIMLSVAVGALTLVILLTFSDVMFRR